MGTFSNDKLISFGDMTKDQYKNPLEEGAKRHMATSEKPGQQQPAPAPRQVDSGYACPLCEREGKMQVRVMSRPGQYKLVCMMNENHKFDMDQLLNYRPTMLKTAPLPPRQPSKAEQAVNVILPVHLVEQLQSRFGDKMAASVESLLMSMVDDGAFVVTGTDAKRMEERIGRKVKSGNQLVGEIITIVNEKAALQGQVSAQPTGAAAVGMAMTPTSVVVDLGQNFNKALEKARFNNKILPVWLTEAVKHVLDNDWV